LPSLFLDEFLFDAPVILRNILNRSLVLALLKTVYPHFLQLNTFLSLDTLFFVLHSGQETLMVAIFILLLKQKAI
jgi:hypothetical protein